MIAATEEPPPYPPCISISMASVPHVVSTEIMSVKHMAIILNERRFLSCFITHFVNREPKLLE